MKTVYLSPQALDRLDRIAKASSVDSALLDAIGFSPASALRFARETGDVPSADVVAELILAQRGETPQELLELFAMAGGTQLEAATASESDTKESTAIGAGSGRMALVMASLGLRAWRRLRLRNTAPQLEIDSEEINA